jgi:hypothetical protein
MDGQQAPEQADVIFAAVEGVYGPQNIRSAKQDDFYGASNIDLPCLGS